MRTCTRYILGLLVRVWRNLNVYRQKNSENGAVVGGASAALGAGFREFHSLLRANRRARTQFNQRSKTYSGADVLFRGRSRSDARDQQNARATSVPEITVGGLAF